MIPISEIERVVRTLRDAALVCMKHNQYDKADSYHSAVYLLEELIPSEVSNSRDTSKHE